jgi:hypothetical protein
MEVKIMPMVIDSVEVIHSHPEGPDCYKRGNRLGKEHTLIADILEINGCYLFFDENDEIFLEIKNCPVVVRYKEEVEEIA